MDAAGLELLRDMAEGWSDVFENQVTSRKSLLDVAAHYPYTPERWRLSVDGQRQHLQYIDIPQYTHDVDSHDISPGAGETVRFQTADDVVYTVQFELALTWAFQLGQALQTGDRLRVGMFNDANGWFMEQTGAHATDEADFVIRRNGTPVSRTTVPLAVPTTEFSRLKLDTAWYRITRQKWTQSYPEDGEQINTVVAQTDAGDQKGPARGNLPLLFEITAGSGTTDLTLSVGSVAAALSGDTERVVRAKNYRETFTVNTTGTYVPVATFRKDPEMELIRTEYTDTNIPKFTGSGDVFGLLLACSKEKVLDANGEQLTDSDFATPNEFSPVNSAVEVTTNVDQFPDNSGTPTTSTTNPGGYQLGLATRYTSGSGGKITSTGAGIDAKRVLADGDYAVLVVRATATGDLDYETTIEQDF
jgi:hypothetical protein